MENTYEELRKNPTCKIERELNNSLKKVEEKDLSTDKQDSGYPQPIVNHQESMDYQGFTSMTETTSTHRLVHQFTHLQPSKDVQQNTQPSSG